jgi:hypothetical protein
MPVPPDTPKQRPRAAPPNRLKVARVNVIDAPGSPVKLNTRLHQSLLMSGMIRPSSYEFAKAQLARIRKARTDQT